MLDIHLQVANKRLVRAVADLLEFEEGLAKGFLSSPAARQDPKKVQMAIEQGQAMRDRVNGILRGVGFTKRLPYVDAYTEMQQRKAQRKAERERKELERRAADAILAAGV